MLHRATLRVHRRSEQMQTLERDGARSVSNTPIVLRTDEARQGVTGHNVRYVLIFGLVGAVVGLTVVGILFAHGVLGVSRL
jgi:hypothetical protein